jgi:hypothetical protein
MSQFLLTFDKTTVFESFFIKLKSVTQYPNYETFAKEEPESVKLFMDIFNISSLDSKDPEYLEEIYQSKAIFRSDFAKVVAVCFGFWQMNEETQTSEKQIKAISKENEAHTLNILWQVLDKLYRSNKNKILVGHNLMVYDIPFYCKRIVKHKDNLSIKDNAGNEYKIGIPDIIKKLLIAKPWEQQIVDTANVFKFGGVSHPTLDQIAKFIGYQRDSSEILNENINKYYWKSEDKEKAMREIARVGSSDVEIMMDFMTEMRTL